MLERAAGLSPEALQAISELERQVVEADGGRLKLEWGRLRARTGRRVEDLLWWENGRLAGFLGFYGPGSSLELAGMVAPDARRRGIGTALLDGAEPLAREYGHDTALLIVPRPSTAGRQLALRRGGTLDHSEHALELSTDPQGEARRPGLELRAATAADLLVVARLFEDGFGKPAPGDLAQRLESDRHGMLIVELDGSPVGTASTAWAGDEGRIFGFVIDSRLRGQGIGRAALRRLCLDLRAGGARRVTLEVEVDNDRALGLYTGVGFTPVVTEDYYALPLNRTAG